MKKKLSIIIPHYNSVDLLERLLRTIPQKETLQVIVVDDKSDEGLEQLETLCKSFANVEFYTNDTGVKSAGTCRNIGLEHVESEWVLFADADDYMAENFYDKVEKYFDTEYDIVYFCPTSIYEETGESANRHIFYERLIKRYLYDRSKRNETLLRYEYVSPCSKMIKTKLIQENSISFDEVRYSNDIMFSVKSASFAKTIAATTDVWYIITKSKNTLTTTVNSESFLLRLEVFIRMNDYLKRKLSYEEYKILNINGMNRVIFLIRNGLGTKTFCITIKQLKENGIPVLDHRLFDIRFWVEKWRSYKNGKVNRINSF